MGNKASTSDSNSSKSDSDMSSNSGNKNGALETMDFLNENKNTIINRVRIVKKSITINNRHVKGLCKEWTGTRKIKLELIKPKLNVFKIKNENKFYFKHWAIILELSNGSFVNIQFGRNGFSLKEFNKTNLAGENILNSIIITWGEEEHPFSFCYLGIANYEYERLKKLLKNIKNEEEINFNEKGSIYYNLSFRNCQHFACDIEKILFEKIQVWHSFDYYLIDFYKHFFPGVDLDKLQKKYETDLFIQNEKLFSLNLNNIMMKGVARSDSTIRTIEKWYSLNAYYYY
jgi:hypothetical protein